MRIWHEIRKFLNKSEEKKPTTVSGRLAVVREKLVSVGTDSWYSRYRPANGAVELTLFHPDPEILLVQLSTLNRVISEGGYVDNAFNTFSDQRYSFDEWFTIRGEFVNFPVFTGLLIAELITLHKAFFEMEVCKVDNLGYYIKKSRMLLEDLEQFADAIETIGNGL